ncbi:hypothetical protein SK128_003202 [Halocaridina rubra]|uniref:F-box domain-containing protein n=1 Tax=Halocaridina rubra TaxID=373956 RepID=A0AAN8XDD2_HALRR
MEHECLYKKICQDCKTFSLSNAHTAKGKRSVKGRLFSSDLFFRENTIMSVPNVHGLKIEAWKNNGNEVNIEKSDNSKICYIDVLPHELVLNIFSYFNIYELCSCIAHVCTSWWNISKDPMLRKHLRFSFERPVNGEQIQTILAGSPFLVTLELQSREDGGNLLLHAAKHCPHLEKLTVKFSDELTEDTFKSLVSNCSKLSYLNVEGSRVASSGCYYTIANFQNLKHLNLSHCYFLDNLGLIQIVKQCRHLEYINIDGITGIFDSSIVYMTTEVGHCLTHLFLDGENLTDVAYKSLSACTKLKMLGISYCEQMTDIGLSGIYELKQLTFLKIRKGVQLMPVGLERLFSSGHLCLLTHVNLGECSLMDDKVLIAMASTCPQLTNLVLQWCWEVTDLGISAIVNKCHHLRVLDLVGVVQLTGESFLNLSSALPNLLILDLEQCNNINDEVLKQVVTEAKRPLLRVFDYWGDPVLPLELSDDEDKALVVKPSISQSKSY